MNRQPAGATLFLISPAMKGNAFAIEAMVVEVPCFEFGFLFQVTGGKEGYILDDMENWSLFEAEVRKRFPNFNCNTDAVRRYENRNKLETSDFLVGDERVSHLEEF